MAADPSILVALCPHCGTRYRGIKPEQGGRRSLCKKCGQRFAVEPVSVATVQSSRAAMPAKGPTREWQPGDLLEELYEVKSILGEGGFGKVFLVHHRNWQIDLAVKSPRAEIIATDGGAENFEREAETWVNLGLHPHTVSCHYVRWIDGVPRVFSEFVGGGDLDGWIKDGTLYREGPEKALLRILDIAIQFAWGLDHAHRKGLIHQDVKPANLLMTPEGTAKVTDFGLVQAKAMRSATADGGQTMMVDGTGYTPAYASPEQLSKKTLTRRTDLWSWAVSILDMFMGRRSCQAGSIAGDVLEMYLKTGPEEAHLPKMPEALGAFLRDCFQIDPDRRPHDLHEAAGRLVAIHEALTGAPYPRTEPETGKETADGLNNRALSLFDLNRRREAEQLWSRALKIDPMHPEATYNRGLLHWRTGRLHDESLVASLEKLGRSTRSQRKIIYFLTLIHFERGDLPTTARFFESIPKKWQGADRDTLDTIDRALDEHHRRDPKKLGPRNYGPATIASAIRCAADGKTFLSGSASTISQWNVFGGTVRKNFLGPVAIRALCHDPDGRRILSGYEDGTLRVWSIDDGQPLATLEGHRGAVTAVAWPAAGKGFFSCGADGTVRHWSEAWQDLETVPVHETPIRTMVVQTDGQNLVTAADEGLRAWRTGGGKPLRTFTGHEGTITALALSRDDHWLVSGDVNGVIRVWRLDTGHCAITLLGHDNAVQALAFTGSGRFVLSGDEKGTIRLWHVPTGQAVRSFHEGDAVTAIDVSPDDQWLLSAHANHGQSIQEGQVVVKGTGVPSLRLRNIHFSLQRHPAPVQLSRVVGIEEVLSIQNAFEKDLERARLFMDEGDHAAAAQRIRDARRQPGFENHPLAFDLWGRLYAHLPRLKPDKAWERITLNNPEGGVTTLAMDRAGTRLISGDQRGTLKLWEIEKGQPTQTLTGHRGAIRALRVTEDGQWALTGGADGGVRWWNLESGENRLVLTGHEKAVAAVALDRSRYLAASGGGDGLIKLWSLRSGHCLKTLDAQAPVLAMDMSADGRYLLAGRANRGWLLWDVAEAYPFDLPHARAEQPVPAVALSWDGRSVYTLLADGTLMRWVLSSLRAMKCEGYAGAIQSFIPTRDGNHFLTGGDDGQVLLWDDRTHRPVRAIGDHRQRVAAVAMSMDARLAASADAGGAIRLWNLDWQLGPAGKSAEAEPALTPHLENFLSWHTPYPDERELEKHPPEKRINRSLTRWGTPVWNEADFADLLHMLKLAGPGWVTAREVETQLLKMAAQWQAPRTLNLLTRRDKERLERIDDGNLEKVKRSENKREKLKRSFGFLLIVILAAGYYWFWMRPWPYFKTNHFEGIRDPARVEEFVEAGRDVNTIGRRGASVLEEAVKYGPVEVVEYLLDHGARVNIHRPNGGDSALHIAAKKGAKRKIGLLIERGAAINAKDRGGWTPLAFFIGYHPPDTPITRQFLAAGADVGEQSLDYTTILKTVEGRAAEDRGWRKIHDLMTEKKPAQQGTGPVPPPPKRGKVKTGRSRPVPARIQLPPAGRPTPVRDRVQPEKPKRQPQTVGYVVYKKSGKKYRTKTLTHHQDRVCLAIMMATLCVDKEEIERIEEIKR